MGAKSDIEWTDASWTPIRARFWEIQSDGGGKERIGWHCEHASEGCRFCYSEAINKRLGTGMEFKPGNLHRPEREGYSNGAVKLFLDEKMLLAPMRWRKPRMIFVCSMTDLFADFVPDEWIDKVFAVMALCPQHTFQVLTKRAERMRDYMHAENRKRTIAEQVMTISNLLAADGGHKARVKLDHFSACFAGAGPFPNVWLGVSCERQQEADERIPLLLQTPAAIRFISAEPLLGPIDLRAILIKEKGRGLNAEASYPMTLDALTGFVREPWNQNVDDPKHGGDFAALDWVIVGGESGADARPMHPDWARSLRDQCAAACVPFFFKQWGAFAPISFDDLSSEEMESEEIAGRLDGFADQPMRRVSKKSAGRLLDNKAHDGMPGR